MTENSRWVPLIDGKSVQYEGTMTSDFTSTTWILHGFAFFGKLGPLLFKPHWDYKLNMKGKTKTILVVVVKWRHRELFAHLNATDSVQIIVLNHSQSVFLKASCNPREIEQIHENSLLTLAAIWV